MASIHQRSAITIPRPTRTPLTSFDPQGPLVLPPAPLFTKDPDHGWIYGHHPLASPRCYEEFKAMLVQRRSTSFAYSLAELPGYHGRMGPMRIKLKPDFKGNLFSQQRRYSPLDMDIIKEKTDELKAVGFIQLAPPDAQVASCPVLPSKKDLDGNPTDKRFCLDVRQLNKATVPDKYGLPRPEALFDIVGRSSWFTKIDLRGAFHQVPIHPDDQHLTTFWLGNQLWCYNRMNYGLTGAPAVLQRIMDAELAAAGLTYCAEAFLDDVIVHSNSEEDHLRDVAAVLDMLAAVGLRAHPDKTLVACDALEYLGYMIGQGYLAPHESKILAIRGLKSPTNVKQLQGQS
jgi:Reverse transcriptase (RNA-dependent DNA polymerase)